MTLPAGPSRVSVSETLPARALLLFASAAYELFMG